MSFRAALPLPAAGILIGLAPMLTWFVARPPQDTVTARGVPTAGELWTLIPLGLFLVVCGVALRRAPVGSPGAFWAGVGGAVAGVLAAAVSLVAVLTRPATLVVVQAGRDVVTGAAVEVATLGPAVAFVGAGLAVLAGLLTARRSFPPH